MTECIRVSVFVLEYSNGVLKEEKIFCVVLLCLLSCEFRKILLEQQKFVNFDLGHSGEFNDYYAH